MTMRTPGLALILLLGCNSLEPANTDLGLRIEARVAPRVASLGDPDAQILIRIVTINPSSDDIIVTTGGPPFSITTDPADSRGLTQSFRISSPDEPLNAGPSVDAWGESLDTIRAGRGESLEQIITVREWRTGWPNVVPGTYRVRSYYNGREGESASFTLTR